ncbi:MAG TPA: flagellar protein FlaG [Sulfurimonas autotrophica]|uniref:Flagellar protein FlaG n=1 Tax=Sulfurimonas autotrophica TaxID=202747 RepID=A0A7C3FXS4_9BACT|nr:flagellar protein FlaG [Sulfurimonas autotrophica]
MDGIANVARQQQSQVSSQETQGRVEQQMQTTQQVSQTRMKQDNVVKQMQEASSTSNEKINSKKDVDELVKKLNEAMAPLNTNIKFGVDQHDIFYVAAIDVKTDRMIRRFPAEQAQDFLPKMQEVTGILFDSKG